jgi:amidase
MGEELARLDATAQAELDRSGEATPAELAEAAIARIEAANGELNAVIHPLFEEGLAAAQGELPDGPFKGVPFLLKDLGAAFAGQPLHLGMQYLKDRDFRAPADSYLAQRFREAGLVTLGKTSCPELGSCRRPSLAPTARRGTPGTRAAPRAAPAAARPPRWPPAWCPSPTPTTAAARSASRRRTAAWSG